MNDELDNLKIKQNNEQIDLLKDIKAAVENTALLQGTKKPIEKIKTEIEGAEVITIKGQKGEKGEKGDKGDKGDQGKEGIQGKIGTQGPKGEKGDKGDRGEQGKSITGAKGDKGDRGEKGPKGDKGDDGKDGSVITPKAVKIKLLTEGLSYKELKDTPDIDGVIGSIRRDISSKTYDASEIVGLAEFVEKVAPTPPPPSLQAVTDLGATTTNAITVIPDSATYTIGDVENGSATQVSGYGHYAYSFSYTFTVFAGKTVDGDILWSENGYEINFTDDGSYYGFAIELDFEAVVDAEVYRVVVYDPQYGYSNNRYFDTTSINFIYDETSVSTGGEPTRRSPFSITGPSFIVDGGTSSQFLKADGSYDSNTYITEETQTIDNVLEKGNTTTRSFTTGKHTISGSGTFFYALDLVNTGGTQTDLRWIAAATTSTGYNYMFGADFAGNNGDNFFIWNLRLNRPAMLYDGVNNITAYNAFTTFDSTGAKVQIKNDFATTNALSINNGKLLIKTTGDIFFADGVNEEYGTTTGTKHGTSASQKQSFWNATPIVQPTTSISGASFTANSGTAVNDASTFDGYTLAQVVKALRNTGLLA